MTRHRSARARGEGDPGVRLSAGRGLAAAALALGLAVPAIPATEFAKTEATNAGPFPALFGASIAMEDDIVAVGAPGDVSAGLSAGAAYIFDLAGCEWIPVQKLISADGTDYDGFGVSVAISGDVLAVGAPYDDDSDDPYGFGPGSVYVFTHSGDVWTQRLELRGSAAPLFFGRSVSLSGDLIAVGAWSYAPYGGAYVFRRSNGVWEEEQRLTAIDSGPGDTLVCSVAIRGDTLVVGARPYDQPPGKVSGSAYVFQRSGGTWTRQQKLTASDAQGRDEFGSSVAIGDETVVVGAPLAGSGGAAYVFTRSDGIWAEQQKLAAADGEAGDAFGQSVAIDGEVVVVGASGSAVVFTRSAGSWTQQGKLLPSDGGTNDRFGSSVTSSGDKVVVGAPGSSSAYGFADRWGGVVPEPPSILPDPFPVRTTGSVIQHPFQATGGLPPLTWSILRGTLPAPTYRYLDPATGEWTGRAGAPGEYAFTVRVTDAICRHGDRDYSVTVNDLPRIIDSVLPAAVDRPLEARPPTAGGTLPFAWEMTGGALPPGIGMDPGTGILSGVPEDEGQYAAALRVTDDCGVASGSTAVVVEVTTLLDLRGSRTRLAPGNRIRALELVAGTSLSVTVRSPAGAVEDDALRLLDRSGSPMDLSAYLKATPNSLQVRRFPVPRTSRYFLRFEPPDGTGDELEVLVKVEAPRTASSGGVVSDSSVLRATFATLPGAGLDLAVRAMPGSAALPTIRSVKDEVGRELLEAGMVVEKEDSARLRMRNALPGGDLRVEFGARGGSSGAVRWTVRIKEPDRYGLVLPDMPSGNQ